MAKKRLSKLQKWILIECYKNTSIYNSDVRKFFGKNYPASKKDKIYLKERGLEWIIGKNKVHRLKCIGEADYRVWDFTTSQYKTEKYKQYILKDKYIATKAEEVSISRSFSNLVKKSFLERPEKYGSYYLTEKALLMLFKWCKCPEVLTVNNFLIYEKTVNFKDFYIDYQNRVKKQRHENKLRWSWRGSEEKQKLAEEIEKLQEKYNKNFTPVKVYELCCKECKRKIDDYLVKCGFEEIEKKKKKYKHIA